MNPLDQPVARERAVVTGATSGIGRAIAVRLAQRGAIVGVLGRNAERAQLVADEVSSAGGVPWIGICDVNDPESIDAAIADFVACHGGIDTAVSSAGIALAGTLAQTSVANWHAIMNTNLNGTFYFAKSVMPELIKARGTFTAISSDAGVQGACGYVAYCAAKHALHGLIKCLALDHGRDGVRANAVCPSFVETPMADQLLAETSPEELEHYKNAVPIGRFARPDEVAAAVAHLSSSEASYVNGLMYKIDGGSTAGYYLNI
ncbi:MAG: SDR family NAD(P)-dependent oxidoreductase [Bradyrhizobium sp.]|nr:SDR family NAD(P)-dependent oxidoreductase [Bradyrhizobium sp.]